MSFTQSFRGIKSGHWERKPIDQTKWIYTPNDLARMQGRLGILAEMGGVQGVAAALRSDPKVREDLGDLSNR